jgi:transposase
MTDQHCTKLPKYFTARKWSGYGKLKTEQRAIKRSDYFKTKDRTHTNYRRAQRKAKGRRAFAASRLSAGLGYGFCWRTNSKTSLGG